jgi:putative hemolysin
MLKNMDNVFVPINKHGKQSTQAAREIDRLFREDMPVLTFPAGLVSRRKNGIIRDLKWKKNFISKAKNTNATSFPYMLADDVLTFFYNLSNFRKFLGIKSNIEMLYLADETYKHRNEKITVKIGKPIPWKTFDKSKTPADWAIKIQDYVYKMEKGETRPFSPDV